MEALKELDKSEPRTSPSRNPYTVNPIKLETGLRPNSAGIPFLLLLSLEAIEFPTFGLLRYLVAEFRSPQKCTLSVL